MDSDTIVQDDLAKLYSDQHGIIKGVHVASAVFSRSQMLSMFLCPAGLEILRTYLPKGKSDMPSLNAGVMVMDLKEWERQNVLANWHQLMQKHLAGWRDGENNSACLWNLAGQLSCSLPGYALHGST